VATAFVLINAELGGETAVMNGLKIIDGVKETHMVYGIYDIIARIEADTMEDLKNIISWKVRRLDRVRSTITMIVI
jgi:DNA-binding Lrp family transcriptional regulator